MNWTWVFVAICLVLLIAWAVSWAIDNHMQDKDQ